SFAASRLERADFPHQLLMENTRPQNHYSDAANDAWASAGGSRSWTSCLLLLWALRLFSQRFRCLRAVGVSLEKKSPARPWSLAQITSACPCSVIWVPGSTQRKARFEAMGTGSVAWMARPCSPMSMLTPGSV